MSLDELNRYFARLLFSGADRRRLYQKLGRMLDNGVPIILALKSIRDRRIKLTSKSDGAVIALNEWIDAMNNGSRFADATADWVPMQERMLLVAGERSGNMSSAFASAVKVMETIGKIKSAVISGVLYPLIVGGLGIMMSYLFGVKIFPAFFKIAPEDRWTGLAQPAIAFSHFVQDWMLIVIVVVIALIGLMVWSFSRWDGPLRIKLDKFPPYSIYRTVVGSTWLIAMSAMVDAGERLEDALVKMKAGSGPWLGNRIEACLQQMREGHNMGDALARAGHNFPDPEIIDDLGVYSAISGFDEALAKLGAEWSEESVVQVQVGMKILFVAGILAVSALLSFLIAGLLSMELQLSAVTSHH